MMQEKENEIMKKMKWIGIMTISLLVLTACGTKEAAQIQTTAVQTAAETSAEVLQTEAEVDVTTNDTESALDRMETGSYPDGSKPEYSGKKLKLTIDGAEVVIAMYDNTAADAFRERLPLEELEFFELNGIEKPTRRPDNPFSLGEEDPGYDPIIGEMVIYRPWGNFAIFYGDYGYSDELVPLGKVESGLEVVSGQSDDFTGKLEIME